MLTHYFVAEDFRRGSSNFRRLPNVAVRSSKPWRDLVSFLLRTHTQHLAPFTAGLFCLESELHFSRNCESGVRNCSLRMLSLVRAQWTCHVGVFVDSPLGYRITLTQYNADTAFLCMVFGLFVLILGIFVLILGKSAPSKQGLNLPQTGSSIKGFRYTKLTNNCFGGCAPSWFHSTFSSWDPNR